jgi:hypothetical protein
MTRRISTGKSGRRISPAAIAAWQKGDRLGVYFALKLWPCHVHPFDCDVDAPLPPLDGTVWAEDYGQIVELRREMVRLAGEPPAENKRRTRHD